MANHRPNLRSFVGGVKPVLLNETFIFYKDVEFNAISFLIPFLSYDQHYIKVLAALSYLSSKVHLVHTGGLIDPALMKCVNVVSIS